MGRKHYSKVLREQIISEVHSGRSVAAVARDYEPSANTIHRWLASVGGEDQLGDQADKAALVAEIVRLRRDKGVRQIIGNFTNCRLSCTNNRQIDY